MKIKKLIAEQQQNELGLPQAAVGATPMQCPQVAHSSGKKILLLGDMPYDKYTKQPFSNASYGKLKIICESAGLDIRECYIHNVLDFFPDNESESFTTELAKARLPSLTAEINALAPDLVIAFGANVFRTLFGDLNRAADDQHSSLEDERGYPRYLTLGSHRCLCIPTYHPTELFARHHYSTIASSDIQKGVRLMVKGWSQRDYKICYWPSFEQACAVLDYFYENDIFLSTDTETRPAGDGKLFVTCIGMAWSETEALVIPFHREKLGKLWSDEQERVLWRKIAKVMEKRKHLGQNAVHYDYKVLTGYGIRPNFVDDNMFLAWQCYQEFPKTLAFQCSLYTDLPYHKDMLRDARSGRIDYKMEFYYCGLDCCTTLQCFNAMKEEIATRTKGSYDRYRFNICVSRAFEYASAHGVHFDSALRDKRVAKLTEEAASMENEINKGLGRTFNVRSPKQVKTLLYDEWGLPAKMKITRDKDTGEESESETADYLTMLYLSRAYPNLPLLKLIGRLRKMQKRISSLNAIIPKDGLVYWDFSVVGTKTGRAAGKKPQNGHGCQPQNVDRRDRDLFLAPKGWAFLKADLEGADSWTQAAQLACLGDSRLMQDLLGGMKPAQVLAIARIYGDEMLGKPASELKQYKKVLKSEDGETIYRISKAVSHGSAYMMKEQTMHMNIFKQSDGELFVNPVECKASQQLFFKRYKFPLVHEFMRGVMNTKGFLDYSDGSRQYFFGRKDDSTLREMLAAAPQCHTGRAANSTILGIFHDPDNRLENGHLLMQPINQVHDETDNLFPIDKIEQARELFAKHEATPQTFWGQTFTIPFEKKWGESWGACVNDF